MRLATISWPPIAMRMTFRRSSPRITSTIRPRPSSCGSSAAAGSTALPPSPRRACGPASPCYGLCSTMPKARLAATLVAAGLGWAEDPSNRDERFERARMRADSEALAKLGLTPEALARSARRLRRARAALDDAAREFLSTHGAMSEAGYCVIERDCAHRRAGRDRASRSGACRERRQRQRGTASACEARIAARRLKRKSEGRAYARRLPPPADRRTAWRVPRDERHWTAFAPTCSRGTRAVGQPIRRRASE